MAGQIIGRTRPFWIPTDVCVSDAFLYVSGGWVTWSYRFSLSFFLTLDPSFHSCMHLRLPIFYFLVLALVYFAFALVLNLDLNLIRILLFLLFLILSLIFVSGGISSSMARRRTRRSTNPTRLRQWGGGE